MNPDREQESNPIYAPKQQQQSLKLYTTLRNQTPLICTKFQIETKRVWAKST